MLNLSASISIKVSNLKERNQADFRPYFSDASLRPLGLCLIIPIMGQEKEGEKDSRLGITDSIGRFTPFLVCWRQGHHGECANINQVSGLNQSNFK